MFRQKYLCVLFVVMIFFIVACGGCGGGSNSTLNFNGRDNTQENPGDNDTPDNPSQPDNPNTPNVSDDKPASSDTSVIISGLVQVDSAIQPDTGESREFIPAGSFRITLSRNDDGEHYSIVTDGITHSEEWHNDGAVDGHIYVLGDYYTWDCYLDGDDYTLSDDGKYVIETYTEPYTQQKIHSLYDTSTELTLNNDGTITCKFSMVLTNQDGGFQWYEGAELTLKPVR